MKEIILSKGKVALVDDEDYEAANKFFWNASKSGNNFYAKRNVKIEGKKTTQTLHAFVMNRKQGDPIIDHKDRDTLNCQKYNLRYCTFGENCRNATPAKNKYSKYKGVWFNKLEGRFMAGIMIDRKAISLGYFYDEKDAARAYNKASLEHHKEFGYQNIID